VDYQINYKVGGGGNKKNSMRKCASLRTKREGGLQIETDELNEIAETYNLLYPICQWDSIIKTYKGVKILIKENRGTGF